MTIADPFKALQRHTQAKRQRAYRLDELADQWDDLIRAGLEQLAQELWPDGRRLELIPVHRYRLRHQATPEIRVWWVEHDIPPYDRDWCAAYRIQLTMDEQGTPTLTVQSGSATHPVIPLSKKKLEMALIQAAQELPLIISLQMGPALD